MVVTYDEHGLYGHPDHVQAHRITMAAADLTGIPDKVYYTAVPRSSLAGMADVLRAHGIEPPDPVESDPDFGTPDKLVTTYVDCSATTDRKYDSLAAHASQSDNAFFLGMSREVSRTCSGREAFVRAGIAPGSPFPKTTCLPACADPGVDPARIRALIRPGSGVLPFGTRSSRSLECVPWR